MRHQPTAGWHLVAGTSSVMVCDLAQGVGSAFLLEFRRQLNAQQPNNTDAIGNASNALEFVMHGMLLVFKLQFKIQAPK